MSESSPKSGRVGTFDNHYRYDHIYPRGRSGETLRAWDSEDNDRPVVVKRPAPQDAPPMRAAQEVSIRTERKALERLAGHPVLTELRGFGTFRVGGQTHEYIVIDRAVGTIIADMVLEFAEQGKRLPLLETLVVIDYLLDLLVLAHDQQVVYNDVDAKHLFWDRQNYRLKVIDWGNAVLLDEANPQGVTRQSDIFQIGELLYFILTGGKRLNSETLPNGDYSVIFGMDASNIPAALQTLITRATQPNLRKRHTTIAELRQHLTELRKPLEEKRDKILNEVRNELASLRSHQELGTLNERIETALEMDPGYPETHRLREQIEAELYRLELQSHIDAGRIYLDTANWPRAIETMLDLLEKADEQTAPTIRFIVSAAELLDTCECTSSPAALSKAIDELLRGDPQQAGVILATDTNDEVNLLLAERLTMLLPSVKLLRPQLSRLHSENPEIIDTIAAILDQQPDIHNLTNLQHIYQDVKHQLAILRPRLTSERLIEVLDRAERAIQAILNGLRTISQMVYSSPSRAGDVLRETHQIDPQNSYFDALNDYFEEVHLAVNALSSFKPKPDGSDLAAWFNRVLTLLAPYGEDLQDQKLHQALETLRQTAELWQDTLDGFVLGRRIGVRNNLTRIATFMQAINQNIVVWANELAEKASAAPLVETLSPNLPLAQALLDGYKLWDQGKLRKAAEAAQKATQYASIDGEKQAVERLFALGDIPTEWLNADGGNHYEITDQAEREIVALFLPDEQSELRNFTEQMPTENAYLRTMGRGLVAYMQQSSTAGVRILFLHYIWRGMLSVQKNALTEADFWREAALKTIAEGRSNPVFAEFDTLLTARKLILESEAALNKIQSAKDLTSVRTLLNQPLADQWLTEAQKAIRQLEIGVRNWEDGDFRAAREAFESVLIQLENAEKQSSIDLTKLKAWVKPLRDSVSVLQTSRLKLQEIAHSTSIPAPGETLDVNPMIEEVLKSIAETTEKQLGDEYSSQLRQWLATYQAVRDTYVSDESRLEKLVSFQAHFAGLFIGKHPTYRLFQIWQEVIQNLPEEVLPPLPTEATDEPIEEPAFVEEKRSTRERRAATQQPKFDDEPEVVRDVLQPTLPWGILMTVGVVIAGIILFVVLGGFGESDDGQSQTTNVAASFTHTPSRPTNTVTIAAAIVQPSPTNTQTPIPTNTDIPPTATATSLPSDTPTATIQNTLVPFIPATPEGIGVDFPQDVLRLLNTLERRDYAWNAEWFQEGAGEFWQLGAGREAGDAPIIVTMPIEFLSTHYVGNAANRLIVVEAEMELAVGEDRPGSYFGLGVENENGLRVSAEVRVPGENLVSWGIRESGNFRERSSFPPSSYRFTLRAIRNPNGTISLYIDGQLLGSSNSATFSNGIPLIPVLYTSGGGVFVTVSALKYTFSPIQ